MNSKSQVQTSNFKYELENLSFKFQVEVQDFYQVNIQPVILLEVQVKSKNKISSTNLKFQVE